MTEDKKKIVINGNRKTLIRNILVTPAVLIRVILMFPFWILFKIGEYSDSILEWFDYKLPGWKTFGKISYTSTKLNDFGLTKEKENEHE